MKLLKEYLFVNACLAAFGLLCVLQDGEGIFYTYIISFIVIIAGTALIRIPAKRKGLRRL